MKFLISFCPVCKKLTGLSESQMVPVSDSGTYLAKCKHGHEFFYTHQVLKFEILFEIAAHALIDGYYRNAVASFASSFERFLEFYVKAICYRREIDQEQVDNSWSLVRKMSERQYGAFFFAHLLHTGTTPLDINKSKIKPQNRSFSEFRNDVIHNGYIPTENEATSFGQAVLDYMRPLGRALAEDVEIRGDPSFAQSSLLDIMRRNGREAEEQVGKKAREGTKIDSNATVGVGTSTIVMSHFYPKSAAPDLTAYVQQLRSYRGLQ